MIELNKEDITALQFHIKKINMHSTLVEEILNKAVSGGVGTAQKKQSKKELKIVQFRAEFRRK